ncbi:MAG: hypothetical protein OXF11_19820 [Deltaproteobacteria bacterium]|nr:hypothetical protein [Deltaproteobacteria bacterium]
MHVRTNFPGRLLAIVFGAAFLHAMAAAAQDIPLNYERLSSLEEPLATEIGDVTFVLNGLLDVPTSVETRNDNDTDTGFLGNFQVAARTQLPNRWRVGLAYFGQYATDPTAAFEQDDGYTDNAAASVGGAWGTVFGGNVSGVVREGTRRARGAGNASLALDDALGAADDWGGGYAGRFGPWVVGATVNEHGGLDLGASFQRPIGNRDYRFTTRYTRRTYRPKDSSDEFDTNAVGAVGEFIYGSTLFDGGVGYQRFSSNGSAADRWYVSAGARHKAGMLSLSLEGHYGRIEGDEEISAALGVQYDLARGLSVNAGINHAEATATLAGVRLVDVDETKAVLSLRYSF